ncbi:MAG TPA: M28 family metallopeptidase [Candidatus Angelobacter sp.]|nr:M28 family metallopeptidase [Candidatus Angelobacter sp.]
MKPGLIWKATLSIAVMLMTGVLLLAAPQEKVGRVGNEAAHSRAAGNSILGFTASSAASELKTEADFLRIPSAERTRQWHRYFTREPHPAASARNNELADYIAAQWKQQGWEDVVLRKYDVLHSAPRQGSLEMVAPVRYKASLREEPYDADPDTRNPRVSAAYLGYSASGEVTAEVVYAHSGNPDDYELLRKNGIDVKGKIVLVRYSNPYSYRGFKALTAEREGAAAMLVYSDPAEDGFAKGKVFPDGPWGPESHIQRGAITYDFIVPGDPTTPGWASVPGARRIKPEEARSLPKIIALPLSWHDARPLLENMTGTEAPKEWQGALPIKYRLSGGVRVHLKVDMDTSIKPYTVVEARIRGRELPDEWVLMGNHRDAWAFGGIDPSSGTASMMELSRALGELKKKGLRPRRTLVICSWDGEEYALTGSTEWGEQFGDELQKKLVAYLNVDSSASGPGNRGTGNEFADFHADAVASLAPMIVQATHSLRVPSGEPLYEIWKKTRQQEEKAEKPLRDDELVNTRIGSGSDHTVFLNHLGRPTVGLEFDGKYGVYHSMYDDHFWVEHFGDPGFQYHLIITRLWGMLALRLANADVLPMDFAASGADVRKFLGDLDKKSNVQPHLDLGSLYAKVDDFEKAGSELNAAVTAALNSGKLTAERTRKLNQAIMQVESNWLTPDGIPGRPWFKHLLYAARYTYAHLELPGLTEAVEKGDWKLAKEQGALLESALEKNAALLRAARAEIAKTNSVE